MSGPRRTREQVQKDRAEVARRYLRGETQAEIAKIVGMTQQQISYDLKQIRKAWLDSSVMDFNESVSRQLARIDELERVHWQSWIDSGGTITKTTTKGWGIAKKNEGSAKPKAKKVDQIVVTEEVVGDPRYLVGVQWCISERNKLLGLYAPTRQDITSGGEQLTVIYVNDWREEPNQ